MEKHPRDRFEDFEELRFGDEPEDEPQPEPDERTTFDRARFDVFDSDPDTEPDLIFTPEPDATSDTEPPLDFDDEPAPDPIPDPADLTTTDWWSQSLTPEPLDDDTPFEILTLDVFDEDDELG